MEKIKVKLMKNNNTNKRFFRQVARDVTGETFIVPDGNEFLFAYHYDRHNIETLISVLSFCTASDHVIHDDALSEFDSPHFNVVTFLFVKKDFQYRGFGSQILREAERMMLSRRKCAIRVQSAEKAVGFFEKSGYVCCGEPIHCIASGSPLFRTLYNMEKKLPI